MSKMATVRVFQSAQGTRWCAYPEFSYSGNCQDSMWVLTEVEDVAKLVGQHIGEEPNCLVVGLMNAQSGMDLLETRTVTAGRVPPYDQLVVSSSCESHYRYRSPSVVFGR